MKTRMKLGIIVVLLVVVSAVIIAKTQRRAPATADPAAAALITAPSSATVPLPRLVDLGAQSCIPCKLMAPILDELRREYDGRLKVDFVDVWQNPEAGERYGVRAIPTQIFYDAAGKELFRHEGFMSKDDILSQWASLGVPLAAGRK